MPSLGTGLSLGTISRINNFDFDASSYITSRGIPNSANILSVNRNYHEFNGTNYFKFSLTSTNSGKFNQLKLTAGLARSFSFWAKISDVSRTQWIFGKELEYAFRIQNSSEIQVLYGNVGGSSWLQTLIFNLSSPLVNNTWTHFYFVLNRSTNLARLYVNGSLVGSAISLNTTAFTSNNNSFTIGDKDPQNVNQSFIGGLKHFWVSSVEHTQANITYFYNSGNVRDQGLVLNPVNLVFYFNFEGPLVDRGILDFGTASSGISVNTSESTFISVNPQTLINSFVVQVKNAGIWNNMVCWPLRNFQNGNTSGTAFSLGGKASINLSILNYLSGTTQTEQGLFTNDGSSVLSTILGSTNTWTDASLVSVMNTNVVMNGFAGFPLILQLSTNNYSNSGTYDLICNGDENRAYRGSIKNASTFVQTPDVTNTYRSRFIASTLTPSSVTCSINNSSPLSISNSTSQAAVFDRISVGTRYAGSNTPQISSANSYGGYDYAIAPPASYLAFKAIFDTNINISTFYSIYKNTLGVGLPLP